jgi:hypothetical protein
MHSQLLLACQQQQHCPLSLLRVWQQLERQTEQV